MASSLPFTTEVIVGDDGRLWREAIEFSIVEHCNLRCARCDHAAPWLPARFARLESFERDVRALARVLHVRRLKFLGGEPLLHPQLVEFLDVARKVGIANEIAVWTNGVLLHKVDRAVFARVDRLHLTLYPGVRIRMDPTALRGLASQMDFTLETENCRSFHYSLLNSRIKDAELVRRIYRACKEAHAWSCHSICDGRYYKCPRAQILRPRLGVHGIRLDNRDRDGIALHDNPNLRASLTRYLSEVEPLEACAWCLGNSGRKQRHRQLIATELQCEIEETHLYPMRLISLE